MALNLMPQLQKQLNLRQPLDDTELQLSLDAALSFVQRYCGALEVGTFTEVVTGSPLILANGPAVAITSITPDGGTAADLAGVTIDAAGYIAGYTAGKSTRTTVVYTAGYASPPPELVKAVLLIAAHDWQTQRPPSGRGQQAPEDTVQFSGFSVPRRAWEWMQPFTQVAYA